MVPAVLAAFFLLGGPGAAQAADLITVYRQAVATSPVLAADRSQIRVAEGNRPLARAGLMPHLSAAAGISRNHAEITGFPAFAVDEGYTASSYSVTLTQPIFNGPAYVGLSAAKAGIRASEAALHGAEQRLALQVSEAYFAVLRAAAERRVALGQRQLLQRILDQAKTFLQVGSGDILSVHEAKARLDASEAERIRADNALRIARSDLERLTHAPVGTLRDLGPLRAEGPRPDRMQAWTKAALKNRPLLDQAREDLVASRRRIDIARRARWPRLDLDAGYRKSRGDFLPGIHREETFVGLNLTFPLYQGGEIGARTRQARAGAEVSRHRLAGAEDQVRLEAENAFLALESSVAELKAAEQAYASAQTSLAATRQGYALGSRSIIDLFTEVQNHAAAQRTYYLARYRHVLARLRLKQAAGVLAAKDLQAVNALLLKNGASTTEKGTSP
jgi:outer membrane protein